MKKPKLFTTLAAKITAASKRRYQANARAARAQQMDDDNDDQPTTKLSSAFIVVLILHVVAVGGIYAFNSIKASRRGLEQTQTATATTETPKTGADSDGAPAASATPAAAPAAAATHTADSAAGMTPAVVSPAVKANGLKQHTVKANENPTKIAFAYQITAGELLAANGLKENAVLHIGQVLTIPESKTNAKATADAHKAAGTPSKDIPATKTTPGVYVVKKGDTVHSIAKAVGASDVELMKLNKIADPKKLQLGQSLKVPPRKS